MLKIKFYDQDKFTYSTTREHLEAKVVSNLVAKEVLVLAPHSDDAVFGCFGALKHLANAGARIKILYIFNGARGNSSGSLDSSLVVEREKEAFLASKSTGVTEINFFRAKEGVKGKKIEERILEELKTRPLELVFIPSGDEWHNDHKNVNEAFRKDYRRVKKKPEVWEYHVWGLGEPNIIFPIDKYIKQKKEAIKIFRSQLKVKKYDEAIEALNCYLGKGLGISKSAEGYTNFTK